jgi:hypothetical protein
MDPVSAIVGALIAGATVAAKDTATQAVKDAYAGLKTLITDLYKLASIPLLEKNPSSKAYQEAVRDEVSASADLVKDVRVLERAKALNEAILAYSAPQLEAWGLKVGTIKAGADVVLERISGLRGGANIDKIEADGNVRISDVHGGTPPEK